MFDVEKSIAEAQEKFNRLAHYVRGEAQHEEAYVVERRLFKEGLKVMLDLLAAYFEAKEGGDVRRVRFVLFGSESLKAFEQALESLEV